MEMIGICMAVFGTILLLSHAAFFPFKTIPKLNTIPCRGRVSDCIHIS
jgi:hypothetical protein